MATGFRRPTRHIYTVHQTGVRVLTQLRLTVASLRAAFAVGAILVAARAGAQQQQGEAALDVKSAAHVRAEYLADLDTLHAKITELAKAIPADKYDWRPSADVRTVAQVLMHIASEYYYYTPRSIGGQGPADYGPAQAKNAALEKISAKSEVLDHLDKSWAHTKAQFAASDPSKLTGSYQPWNMPLDRAAFNMDGDLHEHLGQLIAYARSVGVKPPWTK
jgi:uncharacterized damage-inducible protein DinB